MNEEIKKSLEKAFKRHDFFAKYISLPCLIVSLVTMIAAIIAGNQQMFIFNSFMSVFNTCSYWLNTTIRDRYLTMLGNLDEFERLQKIRDLNPNKR